MASEDIPKTPGTGRMKEDRLSREDWLDGAMGVLGRTGPGGLRIAQVCAAMGVSKGSFYWHFRNREDLLQAVFDHWRRRETSALIDRAEASCASAQDRIWYVVQFVTLGGYDVGTEVAMRQWGQSDRQVYSALAQVDAERLGFFTRQYVACGFAEPAARYRATATYALTLSCGYMVTGEPIDLLEQRLRYSVDHLLRPEVGSSS